MLLNMEQKLTMGRLIAAGRKAHNPKITQADLAAEIGVTPQAVSGWERDESTPEIGRLTRIARALDINVDNLFEALPAEFRNEFVERIVARSQDHQQKRENRRKFAMLNYEGTPYSLTKDLPVYAAAEGGNGHMIVTTEVIEYVSCPKFLEDVPQAYAIRITGASMEKAYRNGDLALVHPHLQFARDEVHIFYDHDHRTGEARSMIKNLLSWNDEKWRVEQFNPLKTFDASRLEWSICHRVVGKFNRR